MATVSLTVLGSGTSAGVPLIGCSCDVCSSTNPKDKRLRSSCLFQVKGKSFLVDTSPDLRQQALSNDIKKVDAILITHTHADHVHGMDDIRIYNAIQKGKIPCYGHETHISELEQKFDYIFQPQKIYPSLVPMLEAHYRDDDFDIDGVPIKMLPCSHGPGGVTYNYRIGSIAWVTDTNNIPTATLEKLKGVEILFLDGLRPKPHPTHFHLEESLRFAAMIGAKQTYLIHLTHDYSHNNDESKLPEGVSFAYDGLKVEASFL